MRVRSTDENNDWQFGKGKNDYKRDNNAVAQNIRTRLQSFVGDCFFDGEAGINWFELLGSKDSVSLKLAISSVILNTEDVIGLLQLNTTINTQRNLTISYQVQTVYSRLSNTFSFNLPIGG